MQAIVEFKENRQSPVVQCFNVTGNSVRRINSIVEQYREYKQFKYSHIYYDRQQDGLYTLTNYKGTSYVK